MRADTSSKTLWAAIIAMHGVTGAAGCVMKAGPRDDSDQVAASTQAIMGGQYYLSCTDEERGLLRSGAIVGRAYANSTAYAQCIDQVMRSGDGLFGPYHPFSGDRSASSMTGHVNNVLNASRTTYPAEITCDDLPEPFAGSAASQGWMHQHVDRLNADKGYLASETPGIGVPDMLWHEAMHTHNYGHTGGDVSATGIINTPGVSDTVPYIVSQCMFKVAQKTDQVCPEPNACPKGAQLPVVTSYPNGSSCECVRDPIVDVPDDVSASDPDGPMDPASDTVDVGELNDNYGSASALGDFNGDGVIDLAVGAPNEGTDSNNINTAGAVSLYYGTSFGQFYPQRRINQSDLASNNAGDRFGAALAAADFNDDGYDDLAVGAPGDSSSQGRVFLFRGSPEGLVAFRILSQSGLGSNENGDRFGHALVRRWDGDEWNLVVSAPGEAIGSNPGRSGYVFVFDGDSADMLVPAVGFGQSGVDSDESGDNFGWSLATGLIDTDDVDDIAVGAPGEDGGTGAAYSFATVGGVPNAFQWKFRLIAPAGASQAGTSVAVGEFLNSTWGSVAVGIPYWDFSTQKGGVAVYDAQRIVPEPGAQRMRFSWRGPTNGAVAGFALARLPPRLGDTSDQLAVGAPGGSGFVQMFRGGSGSMTISTTFTQAGLGANENGDSFGYSFAAGTKQLGFGSGLVVGAPGEAPGSEPAGSGAVYVVEVANGGTGMQPIQYHVQGE